MTATMTRTDCHRPSTFDPAEYEYVGSFDAWPAPVVFVNPSFSEYNTPFGRVTALNHENALYVGGYKLLETSGVKIHFDPETASAQCDHCGARTRYVSIFLHKPTGKHLAVGNTCADDHFGCSDRREYEIRRLREHAASQRKSQRAFGKAHTFAEEHCPELAPWMLSPRASEVHPIFADMARKLIKWGSLSEKQIEFAAKLLAEHFQRERNGGRTDREVARDAERSNAPDCPQGRIEITGEVVKTDVRDGKYGTEYKMTIKDDRGFLVWMSIPSNLQIFDYKDADGYPAQRGLKKGDRVKVVANVTRSDRDSKFGFGKRPIGNLINSN